MVAAAVVTAAVEVILVVAADIPAAAETQVVVGIPVVAADIPAAAETQVVVDIPAVEVTRVVADILAAEAIPAVAAVIMVTATATSVAQLTSIPAANRMAAGEDNIISGADVTTTFGHGDLGLHGTDGLLTTAGASASGTTFPKV
jgi:hypothetical protein